MSDFAARIIDANLEEELSAAFGRYAKATILDRAIPDVRDGLKPVQRRIIYAMYLAGNHPDKRYRKCAKTVGEVMGNFHPHGDQSIYDAMVRLAQHWKMSHTLIDGHGNFGSVDDDPPAAMRYTEARLAPIAMELTQDLEKDTVVFQPNFDDNETEPTVLPARYPNLLVNGTSGVSTGFSTEIQPHNLGEVIDGLVALIEDPKIDLDGLMEHIKGPDFPTGGTAMGMDGVRSAYETGKGRLVLRSKTTIESGRDGRKNIIIAEIPYGVIKSNLVRDIEKLRVAKVVQGVKDVRDESDREGLRIVVELGRGVDAGPVLAYLYKKTSLQVYRHFHMVAILKRSPRMMGLKEILVAYLEHQKEVVRRRTGYDFGKARKRLHLVEGLIKAVNILDEVIATIRASQDRKDAHANLMAEFSFTDEQTTSILDLRLHRLTSLQILQLQEEEKQLTKTIKRLEKILKSNRELMKTIQKEILEVKERHAGPRRTVIQEEIEPVAAKIDVTVTVKEQPVVVGVSNGGYVKRAVVASFEKTDGDPELAGVKEGDYSRWILGSNTLHQLLLFTENGQCCTVAIHQVPECKWGDIGTALVNVVGISKEDKVVHAMTVSKFKTDQYVTFVTQKGMVKRTCVKDFDSARTAGVLAIKLTAGDKVVSVISDGSDGDLLIVTHGGVAIRFGMDQISVQGRNASGVRGINLRPHDAVIGATRVGPAGEEEPQGEIAVITREGRAKRTPADEYPAQRRGGRGVRAVTQRQRMPHRLTAVLWLPPEHLNRREVRLVLDNSTAQTQPIASMRSAARDGNGYEFATEVPARVHLACARLLPLEPLEEAENETGLPADVDAAIQEVLEKDDVEESPPEPQNGNRGSWISNDEDGQSSLFLPGMQPEEEDNSESED
jgi:topoisomerase-4 subunit A